MTIGFEFVSLSDTSNQILGHLHYVLFISCVFLPETNTVHSLFFPAAAWIVESVQSGRLCQRGSSQSHRHHDPQQIVRIFGAETDQIRKPKNGQRLRRQLYFENVLLSIRQLLRLHFLHRVFQRKIPRIF